jgi:flagellar export protein FliJ
MGFVFRYQTLLDWKRNLEELAQIKLAETAERLRAQEEAIRQLNERRRREEAELQHKMVKGIEVGELLTYKQSEEDSYRELLGMEERRQEITREMEQERQRLVGLMRERKTLEKLEERSLKAFNRRMDKLEQKTVDELFLARTHRKLS